MLTTRGLAELALPLFWLLPLVVGHGRLYDPPSRSTMWRFGFNNTINYNDNQLYCGGYAHQWNRWSGKCGVCGDPYDGPRDNEAGGRYANGIIVKRYPRGAAIEVTVQLTANHRGYFEFSLCPTNDPRTEATEACFRRHVLPLRDGGTRYQLTSSSVGLYYIYVVLPPRLTCRQCVFRWKYNTGNSWGCDRTSCCLGCGSQEQFYGCSDIAIGSPPTITTTTRRPDAGPCEARHPWNRIPAANKWCQDRCRRERDCPPKFCGDSCKTWTGPSIVPFSVRAKDSFWNEIFAASNDTASQYRRLSPA